jgi:hypothetical protein
MTLPTVLFTIDVRAHLTGKAETEWRMPGNRISQLGSDLSYL